VANEVIVHSHIDKDRVTIEAIRTYNVAQYEKVEFVVGLASDKRNDETTEEAFGRVEKLVLDEFEDLCSRVEGKHKTKSSGGIK
jgi:hypothetical protein